MNKQIQELLHKEMDRKEFLATLGFGVASIFGLAAVLNMAGIRSPQRTAQGYGSSVYGGSNSKRSI